MQKCFCFRVVDTNAIRSMSALDLGGSGDARGQQFAKSSHARARAVAINHSPAAIIGTDRSMPIVSWPSR